jgi:hypothetical protein
VKPEVGFNNRISCLADSLAKPEVGVGVGHGVVGNVVVCPRDPRDGTLCRHSLRFPTMSEAAWQCFLLCLDPDPRDLRSGQISTVRGSMDSGRSFG